MCQMVLGALIDDAHNAVDAVLGIGRIYLLARPHPRGDLASSPVTLQLEKVHA